MDTEKRVASPLRAKVEAMFPTDQERGAIALLIECAKHDTGQSRKCADFLLAWWNGDQNGGFDLVDLWGVDDTLATAMVTVFSFIRRSRYYPNTWGYREDFERIWELWRGPGWKRTYPP
ncbi:MAG: hypothetical protein FWG52_10350 [Proteobacteria bacterium]|nr:hypothetical protein [Pseudomonadota bacterium]